MLALFGLFGLLASGLMASTVLSSQEEDGSPDAEDDLPDAAETPDTPTVGDLLADDPAVDDLVSDDPMDQADPVAEVPPTDMTDGGSSWIWDGDPVDDLTDPGDPTGMPQSDDLPDPLDAALLLDGSEGADILNGGGGNDVLAGLGGADALSGSGGDDRLAGGDGADALDGGAGNDLIDGGDGADWISAGDGADGLTGGAGDDHLAGQSGDDLAQGGLGNDSLLGGEGNDSLHGEAGDDWLHGAAGDDALLGGAGADTLDGGEGNDTLDGGSGADFLNAGEGDDLLRLSEDSYATGGAGADAFDLTAPGASVIADYDAAQDRLAVVYTPEEGVPPPVVTVRDDGADALILSDGEVLARVLGAAGLSVDAVALRAE